MDKLVKTDNTDCKRVLHPSIQSAMELARAKIDHYRAYAESSSLYRIAMGIIILTDVPL
jgi:hypothetical protein